VSLKSDRAGAPRRMSMLGIAYAAGQLGVIKNGAIVLYLSRGC
jgi:hypothetical protein